MRNDQLGPRVGIFFVYENCLLVEGTPVNEAQPYGDFMGHAGGHPDFWRNLQRNKNVPREVEYDEVPRDVWGTRRRKQSFTSSLIRASWRIGRSWIRSCVN